MMSISMNSGHLQFDSLVEQRALRIATVILYAQYFEIKLVYFCSGNNRF